MRFPYGELVEVLEASVSEDAHGNEVESWDSPTVVDSDERAAVEPRPTPSENNDARNAVTHGFTLYCKPGLNVTAKHRVRVRGQMWDVLGEPAEWRSPFTGWEPGTVVQVGRVDG